jgi:hypothetical protein
LRAILCLLLIFGMFIRSSAAQLRPSDDLEANPGRPTVSTPATLAPVGYLQFETGFLPANHSPEFSSRYGFNEVMELSIGPRLELLASGEPTARYTADRKTANSVSDVFLGVQAVLSCGEGAKPTVGPTQSIAHRNVGFGGPTNAVD